MIGDPKYVKNEINQRLTIISQAMFKQKVQSSHHQEIYAYSATKKVYW